MSDSFTFNLIGGAAKPFGGYISERDRTSLSPRFLVRGSKNVYIKNSGTIAARPGLKRRGTADSSFSGISSSFEWSTSLGALRPLRVTEDGKLQVESDIATAGEYVWHTLLSGFTNTRLIFDTWWDNTKKKDILIFCDGTSILYTWSGGIGLLDSATTTPTVIGLKANAAALGFRSDGGAVIINGNEYAYSGISGNTLTGASDATGEADNSVVLDMPALHPDTPESSFNTNFLKVVNNQLYCGSETSRLVYISTNANYIDFTPNSPRTIGDADIITLDETPVGIGARDGKAHIATESAWYTISFNRITVGTTLTEQTIVEKIPMASRKGALRHEFIGNVGNDLVYLSQDQQLHVFGTFRNVNQPQFPSLSDGVKTELENEDFTGGHLRAIGDFIYLTAPTSGRVWINETRTSVNALGNIQKERLWHSPFIWNIARIALIDGTEYGHSNSNPQLYQMWGTLQWHDDSPTGDKLPYDCVAAFAYQGRKSKLSALDKLYVEGYMSPGSNVRAAVAFEYKGERSVQDAPINASDVHAEFYTGDIGTSLGDSSLGDNPLGDVVMEEENDQELLPKFRVIADLSRMSVFEWQVRIYSSEEDSRWEILCLGTNDEEDENAPTHLRR